MYGKKKKLLQPDLAINFVNDKPYRNAFVKFGSEVTAVVGTEKYKVALFEQTGFLSLLSSFLLLKIKLVADKVTVSWYSEKIK